jgi:hypothetical protein
MTGGTTSTTSSASTSPAVPSVGSTITNAGQAALVANDFGDGFTLDNEETGLTMYERDGTKLASLSTTQVNTTCGLLDIQVAGHGREIITEDSSSQAAEGLRQSSATLTTSAWNPSSGQQIWSDKTSVEHASGSGFCGDAEGNLGSNPYLSATYNGLWIAFSGGSGTNDGVVINAVTGAQRPDPGLSGTIGNYVLSEIPYGDFQNRVLTLSSPATGQTISNFRGSADDDPGAAGTGISLYSNSNEGSDWAVTGSFLTDSDGTTPPSGLTSDGERLLALYNGKLVAFQLPSMKPVWSVPPNPAGEDYLEGDGGGVVVVGTQASDGTAELEGLNDSTGKLLWTVGQNATYCGVSNSEVMVDVNSDFTNLDIETGRQRSYVPDNGNDCPTIQAGGIGADSNSINVTQYLTP